MGAYKQFLASDVIVTPLTLNKSYTTDSGSEWGNEFKSTLPLITTSNGYKPYIYIDNIFQNNIINNTLPDYGLTELYNIRSKSRTSGVTTNYTGFLNYSGFLPNYNLYCFSIWFNPTSIINSGSSNQTLMQFYYSVNTEGAWYIGLGASTGTTGIVDEYITIINTGLETEGGSTTNRRTAIADGGNIPAGQWSNLTFNWNQQALRYDFYLNNIKFENYISSSGANSGNVKALGTDSRITGNDWKQANDLVLGGLIGGASGVSGNSRTYFNGKISSFWAYQDILTPDELTYNYNLFLNRYS